MYLLRLFTHLRIPNADSLNHASIIDGIRLCKAQRHRYNHMDMGDLERILKETQGTARNRLIVTDGVFRYLDCALLPT